MHILQELCPVPAQQQIPSLKSIHRTHRLSDSWFTWHVHYILSIWLNAITHFHALSSFCLSWSVAVPYFDAFFQKPLSIISKPPPMYRVSLHVHLTPPSCLLDLFIMPARGNCVRTLLGFMFFVWDTTVTREACWLLLILVSFWFHFSCVLPSAAIYFDLFSAAVFPLPPFIDFKSELQGQLPTWKKNTKSWNVFFFILCSKWWRRHLLMFCDCQSVCSWGIAALEIVALKSKVQAESAFHYNLI